MIDIHPEVLEALQSHKPVVALESTIITHGMPRPVNLTTARSVEQIVRSTGSIPATIGLIDGRVKVGLQPSELERLAEGTHSPVKLSRRDIGAAIALRRDGGTTCSSTLIFAAAVGIKVTLYAIAIPFYLIVCFKVFATGGQVFRVILTTFSDLSLVWEAFTEAGKIVSIDRRFPVPTLTHCPKAFDISADLHELSRCPVGLVSAGVKSILDIGRFVFI